MRGVRDYKEIDWRTYSLHSTKQLLINCFIDIHPRNQVMCVTELDRGTDRCRGVRFTFLMFDFVDVKKKVVGRSYLVIYRMMQHEHVWLLRRTVRITCGV